MILEKIIENKKLEIKLLKQKHDISFYKKNIKGVQNNDFLKAIESPVSIIAEVKKLSPSAGLLKEDYDPVEIALDYQRCGASAVSVLTDNRFFGGSIEHLREVTQDVTIPVLRKDFVIDEIQIYEARANGAAAILLIARVLDDQILKKFVAKAKELGMETLVEVHSKDEILKAINSGTNIIGINNRDLDTLKVDLNTTIELKKLLPKNLCVVSESGIKTGEDIRMLKETGINAVLIGESLMRSENISEMMQKLTK